MRTAVSPPSTAPVVLHDVDDLAEADLDALLAGELTIRPGDALELARAVVGTGGLALEGHALDSRTEPLLG